MTQPLGFYGVKDDLGLIEATINTAPIDHLTNCLDSIATELNAKHYMDSDTDLITYEALLIRNPNELTDMEKLGMIRALCDRIELRLMEQAK